MKPNLFSSAMGSRMGAVWLLVLSLAAIGCSKEPTPSVTSGANEAAMAGPVGSDLLTPYLAIQAALAGDTLDGVPAQANALAQAAAERGDEGLMAAARMAEAESMAAARLHFDAVSKRMIELVNRHGVADGTVRQAYCPMAFNNRGASWLQAGDVLANPYFGARMLRCGEFQGAFSPAS